MGGDLISRSSLLQTLKYNKAINEDDAKGKMMVIPVDNVIEYVEKMPTAYNVDKVVEQFERKKSNEEDYCVEDREIAKFCNGVIDGFIEIVKAGGVE